MPEQRILVINAANYGEATKQLHMHTFDHVITDAVLSEGKSGLDILRVVRDNKLSVRVTVCHNCSTCKIGNKTWNIVTSLEACFKFAYFYKGTGQEYMSNHCSESQKCA